MLADAASADRSGFARDFDVCVIGAGPAGITLARRLAARGREVALLEAGPLDFSEQSQTFYEGEITGLDYFPLDTVRLRHFGGSSGHWGGYCRALDPYDFAPKPFNPRSGWPIGKSDLDPYAAETDAILDLPSAAAAPDLPVTQTRARFRRVQFRYSPPTNFATKFGDELIAEPRITLILNANLVDLRLGEEHRAVTEARFCSFEPGDPGFAVRARTYVLCCGGIENARLLLNFTSQEPAGIGNRNDLVGRYFCEHPHYNLAELVIATRPEAIEFYAPTERFIAERETLNFGLRLEPGPPVEPGVCLALPADCLPGGLAERYPATGLARMAQEQALNPDSRVRLVEAADTFGLRRVALDWRLGELDVHTMREAVIAFGQHLAEQDLGRAHIREWLLAERVELPGTGTEEVGGKHHMCTTRMAADPREGVVDADCLVHGLANLYIGGSSVFANPGHANPTYTIIQLALRLGDHLTA